MDNLTEVNRPWQSTDYHWLKIQSATDSKFWYEIKVRNSDDCDHPFRRIATSAARVQTTPLDDGGCDASRLVVGQAQ